MHINWLEKLGTWPGVFKDNCTENLTSWPPYFHKVCLERLQDTKYDCWSMPVHSASNQQKLAIVKLQLRTAQRFGQAKVTLQPTSERPETAFSGWPDDKHSAGQRITSASWVFAQFAVRCSIVCDKAISSISCWLTMPPVMSQLVWTYVHSWTSEKRSQKYDPQHTNSAISFHGLVAETKFGNVAF